MRNSEWRGTVMVIADDEELVRSLDALLVTAGYEVLAAPTVHEAGRALADRRGRVVVLLDPLIRGQRPAIAMRVLGARTLITIPLALACSSGRAVKRLIAPDALLDLIDQSARVRRPRAA
jgi:DNA-binding NtrC family response regulator